MTHYSEEFRASVAARLLPPNNARIADIVKETGVPKDTLYDWRARYRNKQGLSSPSCKSSNQYSADDKLAVIIETGTLNETELSEYCRCKGLYPATGFLNKNGRKFWLQLICPHLRTFLPAR